MKIPVLTADDICKGTLSIWGGRRCLVGWVQHIFDKQRKRLSAISIIRSQISNADVPEWNDSHSKEECAAAWNACRPQFAAALGVELED
jgi:hypothetical protein